MRNIFLILCITLTYSTVCQTINSEGLFSAADHFSNSFAQISWTLGENQTSTYRNEELIMTQGFLQTKLSIIESNHFPVLDDFSIDVFPNPVQDILNIRSTSTKNKDLYIDLFSFDGKKIHTYRINRFNMSSEIIFTGFQSGYYILKVFTKDHSFLKTFKILYQN